ncbi:MAG: ABC transporter substrate-binding protein [Rhodopila sp.]
MTYDFDLNPLTQFASPWPISEHGLCYTFNLRPGAKWHNGRDPPVAFSIGLLQQAHPRGRSTFAPVADIETQDPHTAVLVLADAHFA